MFPNWPVPAVSRSPFVLPIPDLARAREIADRKGIGYQTLLKMLVHEGLQREAADSDLSGPAEDVKAAWTSFCRSLFATSDFRYLN